MVALSRIIVHKLAIQCYRLLMLASHESTNLKSFKFAIPICLRINKSSRAWFADASLITHRKHISQTQRFNITSFIFSTMSVGSIFVFTSGISTWAVSPPIFPSSTGWFPSRHQSADSAVPVLFTDRGPSMKWGPVHSEVREGEVLSTPLEWSSVPNTSSRRMIITFQREWWGDRMWEMSRRHLDEKRDRTAKSDKFLIQLKKIWKVKFDKL